MSDADSHTPSPSRIRTREEINMALTPPSPKRECCPQVLVFDDAKMGSVAEEKIKKLDARIDSLFGIYDENEDDWIVDFIMNEIQYLNEERRFLVLNADVLLNDAEYNGLLSLEEKWESRVDRQIKDAKKESAFRTMGKLIFYRKLKSDRAKQLLVSPLVSIPYPLTWRDGRPRPHADLDDHKLAFVDRTDAVRVLMKIHRDNHIRAKNGHGLNFSIPFIDNMRGMGKSYFAANYIWECQAHFEAVAASEDFQTALGSARTIILTLGAGELYDAMGTDVSECESAIVNAFVGRIRDMKDQITGSTERIKAHKDSSLALTAFIEETKVPLFLVIDGIGNAFTSPNAARSSDQAAEEKKRFLQFCSQVVKPWLFIPNLFILFTGRADLLDLVYNGHPLNYESGSLELLRRIGLNMIRREYIPYLLANTWRRSRGGLVRLDDFFGINQEEKQKKFIEALLARTNGHPRSMLIMLMQATDYDSFIKSADAFDPDEDGSLDKCLRDLLPHHECIKNMLDGAGGTTWDLTARCFPNMRDSFTLAALASRAFIRWEGDIERATLFVSSGVKQRLSLMFMPLKAFLGEMRVGSEVIMSAYANFERCCQKRFQELFPSEGQYSRIVDAWFSKSECLRELKPTLKLDANMYSFPKIAENGSATFNNLSQDTARPKLWPKIREAMIKESASGCFVSRDKSASSDVVFVSQGVSCTVTIGLACKCYQGSMSTSDINEERRLFNRMFSDSKGNEKEVNLLIICNTGTYTSHQMSEHELHTVLKYDSKYKFIHETILLNLSTPELRKAFFGLSDDPQCAANLEALITKEFHQKV